MFSRASAAAARVPLTEFFETSVEHFATGAVVPLKSLWSSKPAVVVFIRRLGCQICRLHCKEVDKLRLDLGGRAAVALVCFEKLGEGSDSDRSFDTQKYFAGDMYKIALESGVYDKLFGSRSTLGTVYGLLGGDNSATRYRQSNAEGVKGNLLGDTKKSLLLGGSFVVDTDGSVLLDHRQKAAGDDAEIDDFRDALEKSKGWKA
jgi:hypothetical protein